MQLIEIGLIILTESFLKKNVKGKNDFFGIIRINYRQATNSDNSSVGRAPDCRSYADIRRSLVRIRVVGIFFTLLKI